MMVSDLLGPVGISLARAVSILQWQCEGPVMYAYPLFLYNKKKQLILWKIILLKHKCFFAPTVAVHLGVLGSPSPWKLFQCPLSHPFHLVSLQWLGCAASRQHQFPRSASKLVFQQRGPLLTLQGPSKGLRSLECVFQHFPSDSLSS